MTTDDCPAGLAPSEPVSYHLREAEKARKQREALALLTAALESIATVSSCHPTRRMARDALDKSTALLRE